MRRRGRLLVIALWLGASAAVLPHAGAVPLIRERPDPALDLGALDAKLQATKSHREVVEALRAGDFDRTVQLAKQSVSADPSDPRAHLLLVLGWVGLGNDADLATHLSELRQRVPKIAGFVHYNLALVFADQNRFFRALQYLDAAALDDRDGKALRLRAEIYQTQGRAERAIKAYEELARRNLYAREVLLQLARLYLVRAEHEQSAQAAQQLIEREPRLLAPRALLGTNQMALGHTEEARATYESILELAPDNPVAWYHLGVIRRINGADREAIEAFERATGASPLTEARVGEAIAWLALGEPRQAQRALAAATVEAPQEAVNHLVAAAIQRAQGHETQAAQSYRAAGRVFVDFRSPAFDLDALVADMAPADATVLAWAGFLYRQGFYTLMLREWEARGASVADQPFLALIAARSAWKSGAADRALAIYRRLGRARPTLIAPVVERADIAYHQGRPADALKGYEAAVRQHPSVWGLRMRLASLYNDLDQPDKALRQYRDARAQGAPEAYVLDQMASTWLDKKNDPEKALEYASRARKLAPDNPRVQYTLAACHYAMRNFGEAAKLFTSAADGGIRDPRFYYLAGMTFLNLHQTDRAARFLEQALSIGQEFPELEVAAKELRALWSGP